MDLDSLLLERQFTRILPLNLLDRSRQASKDIIQCLLSLCMLMREKDQIQRRRGCYVRVCVHTRVVQPAVSLLVLFTLRLTFGGGRTFLATLLEAIGVLMV